MYRLDASGGNDGGREQPALRLSQMEEIRDAPVEEDAEENEEAIGDGDGEEVRNAAAKREELNTHSVGSVSVDDHVHAAKSWGASVNQQHVQAEAGINGSRDVDGVKVNQRVILPLLSWIETGYAVRQCLSMRPAWFVQRRIHKEAQVVPWIY